MTHALRRLWADTVLSNDLGGRYLFVRGEAILSPSNAIGDSSILRFLRLLSDSEADLRLLCQVYYLCQPAVVSFFSAELPQLLRALSYRIERRAELTRKSRSGVLWPETLVGRLSGTCPPGVFCSLVPDKSPVLPENELLRWFLGDVARTVGLTNSYVGAGALHRALRGVGVIAETALRNPYMRSIPQPSKPTARMRLCAARNRNKRYRALSRVAFELADIALWEKWDSVVSLVRCRWLEPIGDEDLFELYVLVLVLDILRIESGFGEPNRIGLIRRFRKAVAEFSRMDGATARVYFDQSPCESLSAASEYRRVVGSYSGVNGYSHRPDITVVVAVPGCTTRVQLIEVKKSADERYRSDSIYKVFGYIHDFRGLWPEGSQLAPKAVLVFPEAIRLEDASAWGLSDLTLASGDDRAGLARALQSLTKWGPAPGVKVGGQGG